VAKVFEPVGHPSVMGTWCGLFFRCVFATFPELVPLMWITLGWLVLCAVASLRCVCLFVCVFACARVCVCVGVVFLVVWSFFVSPIKYRTLRLNKKVVSLVHDLVKNLTIFESFEF